MSETNEPFSTDVLIMGTQSSFRPVLVWISCVICVGLSAHFSIEAGLDRRLAAGIFLPLVVGCFGLFFKMALGGNDTLSVKDGVLLAKRGRTQDRVPLAHAQVSWGKWTGGTSDGGAQLVGPVLVFVFEGHTTTVGTTDADLAQTLGIHQAPMVYLDPKYVINPQGFIKLMAWVNG